jgi:hypothetical protein
MQISFALASIVFQRYTFFGDRIIQHLVKRISFPSEKWTDK